MNAFKDNLKAKNVDILTEEGLDMTKNHKTSFIQNLKVFQFLLQFPTQFEMQSHVSNSTLSTLSLHNILL
jgi:hypothetical protein